MINNNEIRVKVNGGYLVAGRNSDPNYDGIYVVFETDEGTIIDIVLTEAKSEYNKELIDVYCYENGLHAFCEYLNEGKEPLHKVLCFEAMKEEIYKALDI